MPDELAVRAALAGVIDPELGDNIVELGMVRAIDISPGGDVTVTIALTTAGCPLRAQLMKDIKLQAGAVPGVTSVRVTFGEMTADEKKRLMQRARWKAREEIPTDIPASARILAIASGKGGVGKSTVTSNLAVTLANRGFVVGVLDADIGGFSLPRMLGVERKVVAEKGPDGKARIEPVDVEVGAGRLRIVSMGLVEGAEEDEAIMLRGLMLNRAVQHFLEDVVWGNLDYLLIDMPPGTSDVQMGLARMLPRAEMVIVTTPALAAQKVATRAADMARKGYLRVAGVIENMSAFVCEHGTSYPLFGEGGGTRLAGAIGAPLLGQVPLDADVAVGGDAGRPAALHQSGRANQAFTAIVDALAEGAIEPDAMATCTARVFDQVEAALGPARTP